MRLHSAAKYFDKDVLTDGYTGAPLYKGQFASFMGAAPDGTTARRRTLSLAPGLVPPARHVVTHGTEKWIIGQPNIDQFYGSEIRQTYMSKKVTDSFGLYTPGQAALNGTPTVTVHAFTEYLKDTVNSTSNSEYNPQYTVTVGINEAPVNGYFLKAADKVLHIRTTYEAPEGFWVLTVDEVAAKQGAQWQAGDTTVASGTVTATFPQTGTYDPITDTYPAAVITTTGILLDRYKLYDLKTQLDPLNHAGDMTLIVAQSAVTPLAGQTLTCPDEWRIFSVTAYHDAWALHLRKA